MLSFYQDKKQTNFTPWSFKRSGQASAEFSHPRALGIGIDHVHGLGAGIDRMGQFLFQTLVRLGYFSNAETQI